MNFMKFAVPLAGLALIVFAYQRFGWQGVLVVTGGIVMWSLLHITRTMQVLKRASDRPIGYVGSAVMLNAKLRRGVNLLHVVAMTRSLGVLLSEKGAQPELYRWTDGTQSHVTCEFANGKLVKWELVRPEQPDDGTGAP